MKRIIPIILSASIVALFIWLLVNRAAFSGSKEARVTAKTVVPTLTLAHSDGVPAVQEAAVYDESKIQPLITLEEDEVFLQAITADLNKDGMTDQICAVKKQPDSLIYLIPALQNPVTGEYVRLAPIRTGVTQTRTLIFYILDIIGDRSNALVFSGMTTDNLQLLAVYIPVEDAKGALSYSAAADLRSDGPISIKEVPRSDAYQLGLTSGDSYPIYTYNSDPAAEQTLDQIERVYKWDRVLKRYELFSESKVAGKKIESNLINQLKGGDVDSFLAYLQGLWYMSASGGSDERYLFFNPADSEIIFHSKGSEEVFFKEAGVPRRYGAYLTTRNRSISSIRRLIDIELSGIDEIKIKVQEDVKLKINVASDWDGVYRKMAASQTAPKSNMNGQTAILEQAFKGATVWKGENGTRLSADSFRYTLETGTEIEKGTYAFLTVKGEAILQLRKDGTNSESRFYRTLLEKNTLSLTQVGISIGGIASTGSETEKFTKE